jgi:transaldolase
LQGRERRRVPQLPGLRAAAIQAYTLKMGDRMDGVKRLRVKIFADGADFDGILKMYANPLIKGFTTNPSLMRKAGVTDYEGYARKVIAAVPDRPISFEVFADDLDGMIKQARVIASWGDNVNVKIPVMNTQREFTGRAIETLSKEGVAVNVTAVFTLEQVRRITERLAPETPAIVSVFAGRIADTGRDPVPHMAECVKILTDKPRSELIWASPRELINIFQADAIGCQIITVTNDVIAKLALVDKDLDAYSLETVDMFYRDATGAGFSIDIGEPALLQGAA